MDERIKNYNLIIVKIGTGDMNALDTLYRDYGGLFFSMAKKYLIDKSYAEDVVSEVFCKIVKSSHGFDTRQNGLNWTFKIIKNTCIDWNKRFGNFDDIQEYSDLTSVLSDFEETASRTYLKSALTKLDETENRILYLKFWEGLSIREIAKLLKKPKSTIQYIYHQSLKKLGGYLDNND